MKIFLLIVVGFVIVVGGGLVFSVLFFPVNTANKLVETAYDAQDKVLNADNAIYNYEWFKQKYQDIEAADKQYTEAIRVYGDFQESLPDSRLEWTFEDKQEDSRLRSVMQGLYNFRESLTADYNARASMATRNIFEDSVLPDYIDSLTFIGK